MIFFRIFYIMVFFMNCNSYLYYIYYYIITIKRIISNRFSRYLGVPICFENIF